jgi:hypothetical protein
MRFVEFECVGCGISMRAFRQLGLLQRSDIGNGDGCDDDARDWSANDREVTPG